MRDALPQTWDRTTQSGEIRFERKQATTFAGRRTLKGSILTAQVQTQTSPTQIRPTQIRRYRAKWWIRGAALFFLAFSLSSIVQFWGDIFADERSSSPTEILVPCLMVLTGILLVGHFFTVRVTLFPDAIEVRTLWSTKRMAFDRIRGRRESVNTDSDGVTTLKSNWSRSVISSRRSNFRISTISTPNSTGGSTPCRNWDSRRSGAVVYGTMKP